VLVEIKFKKYLNDFGSIYEKKKNVSDKMKFLAALGDET
jgi:hypothetical protein